MAMIRFTESALAGLKKAVRLEFPNVGSSHVSECLAAALGFNKHASLLAAMQNAAADPPFLDLDEELFTQRLEGLGHEGCHDFSFDQLHCFDDLI